MGHGVFKDGVCIATAECVLVHVRDGASAPIEGELRAELAALLPDGADGGAGAAP